MQNVSFNTVLLHQCDPEYGPALIGLTRCLFTKVQTSSQQKRAWADKTATWFFLPLRPRSPFPQPPFSPPYPRQRSKEPYTSMGGGEKKADSRHPTRHHPFRALKNYSLTHLCVYLRLVFRCCRPLFISLIAAAAIFHLRNVVVYVLLRHNCIVVCCFFRSGLGAKLPLPLWRERERERERGWWHHKSRWGRGEIELPLKAWNVSVVRQVKKTEHQQQQYSSWELLAFCPLYNFRGHFFLLREWFLHNSILFDMAKNVG